jgi:hypothetical protein
MPPFSVDDHLRFPSFFPSAPAHALKLRAAPRRRLVVFRREVQRAAVGCRNFVVSSPRRLLGREVAQVGALFVGLHLGFPRVALVGPRHAFEPRRAAVVSFHGGYLPFAREIDGAP